MVVLNHRCQLLHEWNAHNRSITGIAFTEKGQSPVSASIDGTVKIWSADTFELQQTIHTSHDRVMSFDITRDDTLLITGGMNGTIKGWLPGCAEPVFNQQGFPGICTCIK